MNQTSSFPKSSVKPAGFSFKNVCLWLVVVFMLSVVGKAMTWATLNSMDATGNIDWAASFSGQ